MHEQRTEKIERGGNSTLVCDRLASKGEISNVSGAKHLAFIPPPMLIVSERIEMSNKTENVELTWDSCGRLWGYLQTELRI